MIIITSRDYWVKVVDFLQRNWALIDVDDAGVATIFFIHDLSGVFDKITYPTKYEAEQGLRKNGFNRVADDPIWALDVPKPPFKTAQHPNGFIYSSGRFWKGLPHATVSSSKEAFAMSGAVIGDIAGSCYEGKFIKKLPQILIEEGSRFTDDTVLTCAVAEGLMEALPSIDMAELPLSLFHQKKVIKSVAVAMKKYARIYPHAGFGTSFKDWVRQDSYAPYNSFGNGSAMRVSFAGWCAHTLEEAYLLGGLTSQATHNHPEAVQGASVIASCIFILKSGGNKKDVLNYAQQYYNLNFTLEALRPIHSFNITCSGTVPVAIVSFLESADFSHMIQLAISMGGDTDTIASIAGSLGEAYYTIPSELQHKAIKKLDSHLLTSFSSATSFLTTQGLWTPQQNSNASPIRCQCFW